MKKGMADPLRISSGHREKCPTLSLKYVQQHRDVPYKFSAVLLPDFTAEHFNFDFN